jgi:hypothetical protein
LSKIAYEDRRFTAEARQVVATADAIGLEYARQGYTLTLRALYYQFIRRDAFPDSRIDPELGTKNTQRNYKWLSSLVSDARIAGLVDWSYIVDTTREQSGGDGGYSSPERAIDAIAEWYTIPKLTDQPQYWEVWVEKEALSDVVSRPASRWNTTYLACKGSPSQTAVHDAARRFRARERGGQKTSIIYLGDHDPTGLDIPRDIQDRLAMYGSTCEVDRIALNMDQITDDLPPSPAKLTDSRTSKYVEAYGTDTWELDALEPAFLDQLVEDAILERLDRSLWDAREQRETREREVLQALSENWTQVRQYMEDDGLVAPEEY